MFYNNFTIIEGRICQTPEIKETSNGRKYTRFSVCYNQPKKLNQPDEKGNEWTSIPNFFNVIAWNKNAEYCLNINKGDPLTIIGKLQYNEWKDENGFKKTSVEIIANSIKKLDVEKKKTDETYDISESTNLPEPEYDIADDEDNPFPFV